MTQIKSVGVEDGKVTVWLAGVEPIRLEPAEAMHLALDLLKAPNYVGIKYPLGEAQDALDNQAKVRVPPGGRLIADGGRMNVITGTVYVVTVSGRLDGIYAFVIERDAQRFADAVEAGGSEPIVTQVPLNLSPEHTDVLIAAERDE